MHAHLMLRKGLLREGLAKDGMLLVTEKLIPDGPLIRLMGDRLGISRDAQPGEMRRSYEVQMGRLREQMKEQGLAAVDSTAALDKAIAAGQPAVVIASEGADFLEGDLGQLEKARAEGLAVLQLVHYRVSDVGDIGTAAPKHNGLTAFGKDVVRACNRLGILVDVAHCTSAGIEQALEISTRPLIYSHGNASQKEPSHLLSGIEARAIHEPLARRIAEKGGVIGLWPLWHVYSHIDFYADEMARMIKVFGARHVGVGTDMNGLPRSVLPRYESYRELARLLAERGVDAAGIEAVLGGNYLRVLREAMAA
jgi:membrane dipeptidase